MLSNTVIGNGLGFWKIMPTRRRRSSRSVRDDEDVLAVEDDLAVACWSR